MPNRRGRTGAKAERPSSCSPVSTPWLWDGGVGGRGFSAVAIFDLLFTEVITPEWWSRDLQCDILANKQRTGTALPDGELRSQAHHEAMGGEWIEIGAWKWVRRSRG